jgi:hypothetical protein
MGIVDNMVDSSHTSGVLNDTMANELCLYARYSAVPGLHS